MLVPDMACEQRQGRLYNYHSISEIPISSTRGICTVQSKNIYTAPGRKGDMENNSARNRHLYVYAVSKNETWIFNLLCTKRYIRKCYIQGFIINQFTETVDFLHCYFKMLRFAHANKGFRSKKMFRNYFLISKRKSFKFYLKM